MSADLDFGKLALKFQGNFELDRQYEKLDCVYYDFSTYLAINTPNVGEDPSSSSDWMLMCQGYGLASEQEVAEGVDNKAVSAKELKNNKATKDDIIAETGDKILTVDNKVELARLLANNADLEIRRKINSFTTLDGSRARLDLAFSSYPIFWTAIADGTFCINVHITKRDGVALHIGIGVVGGNINGVTGLNPSTTTSSTLLNLPVSKGDHIYVAYHNAPYSADSWFLFNKGEA